MQNVIDFYLIWRREKDTPNPQRGEMRNTNLEIDFKSDSDVKLFHRNYSHNNYTFLAVKVLQRTYVFLILEW